MFHDSLVPFAERWIIIMKLKNVKDKIKKFDRDNYNGYNCSMYDY